MPAKFVATVLFGIALAAMAQAAPPIELELATERGVQITAPREWLQLLAGIGMEHVQIRGATGSDKPLAENRGSEKQPSYHVVGMLTSGDTVRLPGGTFGRGDRAKLKDYFDRLGADGAESLTAARGMFGLTEKELKEALTDLAQPIDFETRGQPAQTVIDRLETKLRFKLAKNGSADQVLSQSEPVADDLQGLSIGAGMAMVLRSCHLTMRPEKPRGRAVEYVLEVSGRSPEVEKTLGQINSTEIKVWPIGWEPQKAPGIVAPSLSESLNAEIDGYSLEEAFAAIKPRLKVPVYFDHAALAAKEIDPEKVQVKIARQKMSYRRLIDRILAQARLGSSLRVDESGLPFLWVTR
jgi:hypothetical protein